MELEKNEQNILTFISNCEIFGSGIEYFLNVLDDDQDNMSIH